jgi:glycosyltransferase involved in cell wall biosynthesis
MKKSVSHVATHNMCLKNQEKYNILCNRGQNMTGQFTPYAFSMHILFITDNFPPEMNAPATRTIEHISQWEKEGAKITVITCFPNFPDGKVFPGYRNRWYKKENLSHDITVIRVWTYITANKGFIKRIIDHISFAFSACIAGLFIKKADVIIATSPQFFTTFTALFLSKVKKKPWIFEVRDMWPEGIIFLKRNTFLYKILEKIELFLYRHADRIISVTGSFKESIVSRSGIPEQKISVIYNGANNVLFTPKEKNAVLKDQLNLQGKIVVGYAGTMGISHGLDFILQSLQDVYMQNKDIHFLFIGSGAVKGELVSYASKHGLQNITFLDSVPKEKVADYMSLFDIGLVPLKKTPIYLKVIPSKIFELAAMHIPILLGVEGEAKNIIERYGAGMCYEPENNESFLKALFVLYEEQMQGVRRDKGLESLAHDFDRSYLADKMLSEIRAMINECSHN